MDKVKRRQILDSAVGEICSGRGQAAVKLVKKADQLGKSLRAKSIRRDARTLIEQQAENNRLSEQGVPDSQIKMPAVVRKRCAGSEVVVQDAVGDDDCSDFESQADAQAHLDAYGNASGLDEDGDGKACEDLP